MKFLPIIILGLILGVVVSIFALPFWVAIVVIAAVGLFSIGKLYYTAFFTTNMDRVRRYLQKNSKDPMCQFLLVLENGTKEDEIEAMDKVIAHYRQPMMKHTYEMNKAIRLDDLETAAHFADKLGTHPFGQYGKAMIAAYTGNAEEARSYTLKHAWMNTAIEATVAYVQKDMTTFKQLAEQAITQTKGMQRFTFIYSFKKMEREA